jgi:hypothetical protein
MQLELTDEQIKALIRELSKIIDGDCYPLSPRIPALKKILGQSATGAGAPRAATIQRELADEYEERTR